MNSYFEVGVRYDKTMEGDGVRKVTENYLLDAISFTEAEKRATEEMKAYISGEFRVVTEKRLQTSQKSLPLKICRPISFTRLDTA